MPYNLPRVFPMLRSKTRGVSGRQPREGQARITESEAR